ncbi:MAG: lytic murein transglycosylase [Acidimicrobiales bacterium]
MTNRRGTRVRAVAAGAPLLALLLGVTGPALAQKAPAATTPVPTTPVPTVPASTVPSEPAPATTTTTATPPETKIVLIEPATQPGAQPAPPPSTPPTTARPTSSLTRAVPAAPAATASTVAADSPALRALVAATAAERRRISAEITDAEARVAEMEAAVAAAEAARSTDQARVQSLEAAVERARTDLERVTRELDRSEMSAANAAEVVQARRTPVARPPSPGHSPSDAAAQARQSLAAATERRVASGRALGDLQTELELARRVAEGSSSELVSRVDALQGAWGTVVRLRESLATAAQTPTQAGAVATATIPADWIALYGRAAATCPGLPWAVLAAVGAVESGHGQSILPGVRAGANFAGAMGPMQFIAGTWAAYGVDGDGDGIRDVYNPTDAVFGAARYLCASGGGSLTTLRRALWAYNHADWYVEMVLEQAARY